ncbi:MAG: hypothetical protein QF681_19075 [Vicinamibacterales bacterium]|nr:hypothetical protein [Vicinamibacterales bacterium]
MTVVLELDVDESSAAAQLQHLREQRDTLSPQFPELENRAFVVKLNRLFRF